MKKQRKEFGQITYEEGNTLSVIDYELNSFDLVSYWLGVELGKINTNDLFLRVGESRKKTDYISGPLSILLFSAELVDFFDEYSSKDIEFKNIVAYSSSGSKLSNYYLVNTKSTIDCLNYENSTIMPTGGDDFDVIEPVIVESKVPKNVSVFRAKHVTGCVFIRRKLAALVKKRNFCGIDFIDHESVK